MSAHDTPAELPNISSPPPSTPTGRSVLNNVLPVLSLAKESVTGLGVPGLEAAVGGTLKIFQMLEVGWIIVAIPTACLSLSMRRR